MSTKTYSFEGRITVVDNEVVDSQFWSYEFDPPSGNASRTTAEWVREHFADCCDASDLRDLFDVPQEGDFQALFKGTIRGFQDRFTGEWDDDLNITQSEFRLLDAEEAKLWVDPPNEVK